MSLGQAFRLAIKSIISNKMRSFLTMLGMIIGVASVIALVGIMQGVTDYILSQFADMGTNVINISVTNTGTRYVDVDNLYDFTKENNDVFTKVSPVVNSSLKVKNGVDSVTTSVIGVGEDYFEIYRYKTSEGRFLQYSDIKSRYNACVVGTYIVDELFDGNVNMGDTLKVNGQVYTIIGIKEKKANSEKYSTDDCIYIPYSNASRMAGISAISNFAIATKETNLVVKGEALLDEYLYNIMKNEDLYQTNSMTALLKEVHEITGTMSTALTGIAGISLLVAGIGIMNIMLVSVVERTKEIGIRKSLGAKKKDIMRQFVIEAAMISSLGGTAGIIIGSIATIQLGGVFKVNASPTLSSIVLAFGVSAAIGIGFGYMPASKAARLNPIDALRSE